MLQNKIALIIGLESEVNVAIAKRFAYEGATIILADINGPLLEKIDDEIKIISSSTNIVLVQVDTTDLSQLKELANSINNQFSKVDILCTSLQIKQNLSLLTDYTEEQWDQLVTSEIKRYWFIIKLFDTFLKRSDNGRMITSTYGLLEENQTTAFWGVYSTIEIAVRNIVTTYAKEVEHTNIKVNIVNPGILNSSGYKKIFPGKKADHLNIADDITDIFVKLASNKCTFTGLKHNAQF